MPGHAPDCDVVVIGGGPAGSVLAARLAEHGRTAVVLERARHPRFHLGESLLPASLGVLEAIGVLDEVRARFMLKRGARFVAGDDVDRTVRYAFGEAFGARWDHAFQVPRDQFDELLFRNAGARGADLREGWEAIGVEFDEGRATAVRARDDAGAEHVLRARMVVDASGRDAIVPRTQASVERLPHLDRTALYTQLTGAWRDTGEREGDIQIVVFGEGTGRGWMWMIPFADGRTSVGAVVSSAWLREHRGLGPEALFDRAMAGAPAASRLVEGAARVFPPRAIADFSFRVSAWRGPGWLAVGDSSGFIDPLFSTGAHLAMRGALSAADAIDAALRDGAEGDPDRFEGWERTMRAGASLFLGVVQAFYASDLVDTIFAEPQRPFLRRAITSMLAGEVFDDGARWVREMRSRFPEVRAES